MSQFDFGSSWPKALVVGLLTSSAITFGLWGRTNGFSEIADGAWWQIIMIVLGAGAIAFGAMIASDCSKAKRDE